MARNNHLEDDHQKALFSWAENYPQLKWMHSIPNGAFLHGGPKQRARQMARLKAQGLTPGVLDVFLPKARGGFHGLYIELKIKPNKPTEKQKEFIQQADKDGYLTAVCYDWLDAKQVISDYMGILF